MYASQLKLAFGTLLWRLTVVVFILLEFALAARIFRPGGRIPQFRRLPMMLFLTPRTFVSALMIGAGLTVAADLFVRFILKGMVESWHRPRPVEEFHGSFHLEAREKELESTPARMKKGLVWRTGTLVLTDRRLWFFPESWEWEPWSKPHNQAGSVELEPGPNYLGGLVTGFPNRLVIRDESGNKSFFALLDAESLARQLHNLDLSNSHTARSMKVSADVREA